MIIEVIIEVIGGIFESLIDFLAHGKKKKSKKADKKDEIGNEDKGEKNAI